MIIFLAGVHGVGKTFLGKKVAEKLGFNYAAASSLIREEIGARNWNSSKYTNDVDRNQEALIASVLRISTNCVPLILDGHFVLRDNSGAIVSISSKTYKRLGLNYVVLIEAPSVVVERRLAERGAPQPYHRIEEMALEELRNAENVCNELGITLTRLQSPSESELLLVVKNAAN